MRSRLAAAFTLALLLPGTAAAQGPGTKYAAIFGGASLSDMSDYSGWSNTGSRWGVVGGFLAGVNTGRAAFNFEAAWVQKGGGDLRLDYIDIPLTIGGIARTGAGRGRVRIYTGIGIGIKVSCSDETGLTTLGLCDDVNDVDWSWPIGLQFAQTTGTDSFIGGDIRYAFPLSDAFDNYPIANRTWQFRLMFGKSLGR